MKSELILVTSISLSILVSGCATMEGNSKAKDFVPQGCATGAFGAAALALIKYSDDPDRDKKVATIAAIGCLAGSVVGYKLGKRTDSYANAQEASEKEIALNRQNAQNLKMVNSGIKRNIDEYNSQLVALRESNFSAEDEKEQKKDLKKGVTKQKEKADFALSSVTEELKQSRALYNQYAASRPSSEQNSWSIQIAALAQEKQILSRHIVSLNALDSSI